MFCKKCGAKVEDGVTVCPSCGNEMQQTAAVGNAQTRASDKTGLNSFFKTRDGKILTGICAGLGKKYGKNPWLFRVILLVGGLIPIIGWVLDILYIVGIFALKYEDEQ